ncbi:MAG: PH domain-containing protein [Acidimicrobiales bacterium]
MIGREPDRPPRVRRWLGRLRWPRWARPRSRPERDPARRYLLPTERRVVAVRQHPAILLAAAAKTGATLVVGGYLYLATAVNAAQTIVLLGMIGVHVWFLWRVARWYLDRFILSDTRIMLVSGIIARKVAMMPLAKLTDLRYERSTIGVVLGYGKFVVESAGQDQPLSHINYLPHPDELFREVSALLFGGRAGEAPNGRRSALRSGPHGSFT